VQTVRDPSGERYLLVARRGATSVVRDPETGERHSVPTADLVPDDGDPLRVAAAGVPDEVRRRLGGLADDRTLGLLVELDARGPLAARTLLAETALCERDLHGALAELRAAGLAAEAEVAGEPGYRATDVAADALADARS
jgi:hypothetical protein